MTDTLPLTRLERSAQLETMLDELIVQIMNALNQRGYETDEILDALDGVCDKRWQAYEEGPR